MPYQLNIPTPKWNSNLANIILNLEKLRTKILGGEIPPYIFFQLKRIFQIMETLGSARIEGNNTTLSEYIEKIIENEVSDDEQSQELENLENAIGFIEDNVTEATEINRAIMSELHRMVTRDLTPPPSGEGSRYPGELRKCDVSIAKSDHKPPSHLILLQEFDNFISFINQARQEQNQLLMVALAHHYFMYIHPYDNGNGRMGRLLNYAFLIKLGFNVKAGRIINPSSVFYTDRDQYNKMLGKADSLQNDDQLIWAEYFLQGLKDEIEKIDRLTESDFTRNKILLPAIVHALEREHITKSEYDILSMLVKSPEMAIKTKDLDKLGIKSTQKKTYTMQKLREKKMVVPTKENGRIYTISFANSYLLRSIIKVLNDKGFIAESLNKNA